MDMLDEMQKDRFEKLMDDIQTAIEGEEARVFSPTVLREARTPSNLRAMEGADGCSSRTGACGDTMEFFIMLDGERIADASFLTDGCGATVACGSMLTKMAKGMTTDEAMGTDDTSLLRALDGLPDENLHCARLAVAAMHRAVVDAMSATGAGPSDAVAERASTKARAGSSSGRGRARTARMKRKPSSKRTRVVKKDGATTRARGVKGRRGGKRGAGPR
jgi:nitrogen fixation NifU-like protein